MRKFFRRFRIGVAAISGFAVGFLSCTGALALGLTPLNAVVVSTAICWTHQASLVL